MTQDRCITWSGRHRFEARYDETPPAEAPPYNGEAIAIIELVKALTKRRYYGDICRHCGRTIEREIDLPGLPP